MRSYAIVVEYDDEHESKVALTGDSIETVCEVLTTAIHGTPLRMILNIRPLSEVIDT